jgi:transcriptional regulator with XRE-family HTH domain
MWTNFPERLRFARQEAKLSTTEVAAVVGVSASTVRRWEKGEGHPSGEARKLLAELVGWEYHALFPPEEVLRQLSERDRYVLRHSHRAQGGGNRLRIPVRFPPDQTAIDHLVDAWLIVPNGAPEIYRLTEHGDEVRALARGA